MTYKNLIDALVRDSGDEGTAYKANAYTWLNFARQEASVRGTWPSSKNSEASFMTDAGNLTGVYSLVGYDNVIGDEMYDATNDCVILRDTENTLKSFDANANEFGRPTLWSQSGMTSDGEQKIRFWPIPDAAYDIHFLGSATLADITSAQEALTIDAYFGPLSSIGAMLMAGIRYYHDLNDNQDVIQVTNSRRTFYEAIKFYSSASGADSVKSSRLDPVGRRPFYQRPLGRLDPGHFNNR